MRNIAILVLAVLLVASCGGPGQIDTRGAGVTFTVRNLVARTVMPNVSLEAGEFRLHGAGVSGTATGASFDLVIDPATPTAGVDLLPGGWEFSCEVWNDGTPAVKVGEDFATATVVVGVPQTIAFDVYPLAGAGTFAVALSWVPDILAVPGAEAELVTFAGVSTDVPLTLGSSTAASGSISTGQGWYTAFVRILDNGELASGIVETVRVAFNAVSTLTRHLTVNQLQGLVTFDASWTPYSELVITTDPPAGDFILYDNQTQTLAVTGADNDGGTSLIYAWYANGHAVALGTGASIDVHATDFPVGSVVYYSAVVWQSDGLRAGDAQFRMVREAADPMQFVVRWTGTAGRSYQMFLMNPDGSGVYTGPSIPGVDGPMETAFMAPGAGPYKLYARDNVNAFEYWQEADDGGATLLSAPFGVFELGTLDRVY